MEDCTNKKYVEFDNIKIPSDLHFLIVEDEGDVAELLKESLQEAGFKGQFTLFDSTEEACEFVSTNGKEIDFIISDWNLKGESGFDFLKVIKEKNFCKDTPFLMVTANDNVSGMLVAIKKGASDYLVKPWNEEELLEKVATSWEKCLPPLPLL